MLKAMCQHSVDAESALRARAVSVSLDDIIPLETHNNAKDVAGVAQVLAQRPPRGGLSDLVRSGAKGRFTHIAQLRCRLGQQLRWSARHSRQAGFVDRCFAQGLTVYQAVDHAMSARVGQVDQAVKTRTVGYLRRRLVALMENVTIEHDGTARLVSDRVVQFQHCDNFEAGDAAGSMCATMIGHAAFQASLDAFKHTDSASKSAPGLPAFLKLVAAPSEPEGASNWVPHDARTGQPDPWVRLADVGRPDNNKVTKPADALSVLARRVLGCERGDGAVTARVRLDNAAMLARSLGPGDVADAVRRANVDRPRWDCTVAADGRSVLLWDGAPWPESARVTGCAVLPSSVPCAAQAQRHPRMQHHVTSCCVSTARVLGVEAARSHFINQACHHLGLQHAMVALQLAADVLFWPGRQIPLTRTGLLQQLPQHTLCRAAYETTMTVFADAATNNCTDPGTTVSSRVCRRAMPRLGTQGPSSVFATHDCGVIERAAPCRRQSATTHATYEVFDFLAGRNNATPEHSPQKKKTRLSRWSDAPWSQKFKAQVQQLPLPTTWSTGCFARPIF